MRNIINYSLTILVVFIVECFATINLNIENPNLCSPVTKRKISLGRTNDSSLVISQLRLNHHLYDWEKNFYCKFEVKSRYKDGIFAVIQNLNLRKNSTSGDCADYILFERKDNMKSRKYCGNINALVDMEVGDKTPQHANNSFKDIDGEMNVIIFINKLAIDEFESQDIRIAFTTYRDKCLTTDMACAKFSRYCIYDLLFNDNEVNCPYYGCVDEGDCSEKLVILTPKSIGNKVLIASISSLLLVFGVFICCLFICKMHRILCWADNFAQTDNSTRPNQSVSTCIELNETPSNQNTSSSSTRPAIPEVVAEEDKEDLPPSYQSLFPSR